MQKQNSKITPKKAENSVMNTGILVDKLFKLSDIKKRKKIKSITAAFITSATVTIHKSRGDDEPIFEKAKRLAVRSFVGVI